MIISNEKKDLEYMAGKLQKEYKIWRLELTKPNTAYKRQHVILVFEGSEQISTEPSHMQIFHIFSVISSFQRPLLLAASVILDLRWIS